jgi:hypothetical protein
MKQSEISAGLRKRALALRNAPSVDDRMFADCRLMETAADEIDRLRKLCMDMMIFGEHPEVR